MCNGKCGPKRLPYVAPVIRRSIINRQHIFWPAGLFRSSVQGNSQDAKGHHHGRVRLSRCYVGHKRSPISHLSATAIGLTSRRVRHSLHITLHNAGRLGALGTCVATSTGLSHPFPDQYGTTPAPSLRAACSVCRGLHGPDGMLGVRSEAIGRRRFLA